MNILDRFANVGGFRTHPLFTASYRKFVTQSQLSIFQVRFALEQRLNESRAKPAIDFNDSTLVRLQRDQAALQKTKDGLAETVSLFTTTINAIVDVESALAEAKALLETIVPASDAAFRADIAAQFDGKLTKLNNEVANATLKNQNMIKSVDRLTFRTDVIVAPLGGGGGLSLNGIYTGTEYYIKENDGSFWHLDTPRTGLSHYTSYPSVETGENHPFGNLVVGSYDPATGSIAISGPQAIAGTVVRGGLGLVNSFLYNGFATDADVANAIADVDKAIAKAALNRLQVRGQEKLFVSRANTFESNIEDVDDKIQALMDTMLDAHTAKILAEETRLHATLAGLSITTDAGLLLIESFLLSERRAPTILDFTR